MLQTNDTLSTKKTLQMLATHAPFELEGAWRLDSDEATRLTDATGARPAGGWRGAAALAAGCGVLEADRELFTRSRTPEAIAEWTAEEATRRMLEAFTLRLVPPTTAAGLFIMLSIHPAWGVHLAHKVHRLDEDNADEPTERSTRTDLFPSESLQLVGSMVSSALRRILDRLAHLDEEDAYSIQNLATLNREVCTDIVDDVDTDQIPGDGLDPLVDADGKVRSNWRATDFTAQDLLDAYLVPAGVATRTDGTFRVDGDILADTEVFTLD